MNSLHYLPLCQKDRRSILYPWPSAMSLLVCDHKDVSCPVTRLGSLQADHGLRWRKDSHLYVTGTSRSRVTSRSSSQPDCGVEKRAGNMMLNRAVNRFKNPNRFFTGFFNFKPVF